MASTSETGHNKSVANFSSVYQILEEMGALYNPTNDSIFLSNLDPIRAALQGVKTEMDQKIPVYKNAVADREEAIKPLGPLMTQSSNFAKSIKVSDKDKENIFNQAKKIRGDQKPKKINPETAETETISSSQMSYDNRISNLATYIAQLESHQEYDPNEEEIKIDTFKKLHNELTKLSIEVNAAGNALITARKNRNNLLYNDNTNVIDLVKTIKAYLKSLGNPAKPYLDKIVKLKFIGLK